MTCAIQIDEYTWMICDDDMVETLRQYTWRINNSGHAVAGHDTFAHHLVLAALVGYDVDHENNNKLDNRRNNLRYLSRSQNNLNRSKTRGIKRRTLSNGQQRFDARVQVEYDSVHVGTFKSESVAVRAAALNRRRVIRGQDVHKFGRGRWA